jgi:hypothetical protein
MPSNRLNVYPDSDYWPDNLTERWPSVIDLTAVKIYRVNGVDMVRLSDLEALNIPIKRVEREEARLPKSA